MIVYLKNEDKIIESDKPHKCKCNCKICNVHILRDIEINYYKLLKKLKK